MILTATLGLGGSTLAAEGTVQKIASTSEGYCHLKIPAARPSTLATDKPELKSSNTEDVIDFYGPCDYDPVGKNAISTQKNIVAICTESFESSGETILTGYSPGEGSFRAS